MTMTKMQANYSSIEKVQAILMPQVSHYVSSLLCLEMELKNSVSFQLLQSFIVLINVLVSGSPKDTGNVTDAVEATDMDFGEEHDHESSPEKVEANITLPPAKRYYFSSERNKGIAEEETGFTKPGKTS
jgi:hypothetical protein